MRRERTLELKPVFAKTPTNQLLVMDNPGRPLDAPKAFWVRRSTWKGHGWFRMKVFQYSHGASSHGWPIGKNEPSRMIAAKRWQARCPSFNWQDWETM